MGSMNNYCAYIFPGHPKLLSIIGKIRIIVPKTTFLQGLDQLVNFRLGVLLQQVPLLDTFPLFAVHSLFFSPPLEGHFDPGRHNAVWDEVSVEKSGACQSIQWGMMIQQET